MSRRAAARVQRRLTWRQEDDGSLSGTFRLPPLQGAVLLKALRAATGDLEHPHESGQPAAETPPASQPRIETSSSLADALLVIAEAFLGNKVAAAAAPTSIRSSCTSALIALAAADPPATLPATLPTFPRRRRRPRRRCPATRLTRRVGMSRTVRRSAPAPPRCSPAQPRLAGCCTTATAPFWTWDAGAARPPRCAARPGNGIIAGAGYRVRPAASTCTTSSTGPTADEQADQPDQPVPSAPARRSTTAAT